MDAIRVAIIGDNSVDNLGPSRKLWIVRRLGQPAGGPLVLTTAQVPA